MPPPTLKLEKDKIYTLRIDDIKEKVKCFASKEGNKCRHDITCSDKAGSVGVFEYVTFTEQADGFILKAWQQVKCVWANEKGYTIEPVPDHQVLPDKVKQSESATGIPATGNQYATNLSGKSITFAVAYAKDILCAEIATRPPGCAVTKEDINGMLDNADIIHDYIMERIGAWKLP